MPIRILPVSRPTRWVLSAIVAMCAFATMFSSVASAQSTKPTIVLVHGAFADASGWNGVTRRLQDDGYKVLAPPNPLRGVDSDAAYIRGVLSQISGPIVLVGHSYGGFVITNAATGNPNVKALVYIAAYAPDEGDTVSGLNQLDGGGGLIGPSTLDLWNYTAPDASTQQEASIKQNVFRKIFAADVPAKLAREMGASQRPAALATLGQPSGPPAWKSIKSYYMVAGSDFAIGTKPELAMAKRMGAVTTFVKGASHVPMVSHPGLTTKFIERAA
jgi:pimeloyl-ACP methyl ester carboxylesterase